VATKKTPFFKGTFFFRARADRNGYRVRHKRMNIPARSLVNDFFIIINVNHLFKIINMGP